MKFNIFCPINETGYGISSYNIWSKIFDKHPDSALFPIAGIRIEDKEEIKQRIKTSVENQSKSSPNDPCLKIWHMHDLYSRIGRGTFGVLPFFETDLLSTAERNNLSHADIVFTASHWSKNVLIDNGVKEDKIRVSPLGVDLSIFNNQQPEDRTDNNYVFINIGKWEVRKSHDMLVSIFNAAFTEKDNVELWMVNTNPFLSAEQNKEWGMLYKNSKLGEKIKIFPRLPGHENIAKLISYADCGVYISRAEGWNNEVVETMAMDKPVILTNYSAHTEYATKDNSYLVEIDELETAIDDKWFNGKQGRWAKIGSNQVSQTVEHMRFVYKNNIKNNPNGIKTANHYTWDNTAKHILESY